ncbi:outer mitochondrial transmembrane helix translocase-like [Coccinella septempunctata]|uniref:outer mitochondrial transmembrane helix translocase-like n=1 Tax=Coccinella septempunctata TaxID=41139 RepID=UPI001D091DD3|nr:outer mitochondrial transmembrane helix translocase-like [Coccinella septempunctata]
MDLSAPKEQILGIVMRLSIVTAITFLSVRWLMNQIDPTNKSKKKATEQAKKHLKRITDSGKGYVPVDDLSEYELMIAAHLVHPDDISVTWNHIAGLDDVITDLRETVILPVQRRDLFENSRLSMPPKGVLLHGPPGCGKTLIAKATAKEAGMNFINLDVSILTDKWYGESQKLAAALFSLAVKLQPCIIFIDEIDSFLRSRSATDHEATAMMKAQFMSWWDGLITDSNCSVIIMGATNRPRDLDNAILRRMPVTFNIGLPRMAQREKILELILHKEPTAPDVNCHDLAKKTDGFTGSDLMELCRSAAVYRIRDFMSTEGELPSTSGATSSDGEIFHDALRPITMSDLENAVEKIRASKMLCVPIQMPEASLDVE